MSNSELSAIAAQALEHARSLEATLGLGAIGVSISRFIANYTAVAAMEHYRHVPSSAAAEFDTVRSTLGAETGRRFLRAALAQGVVDLIGSQRMESLPPRIGHHHTKHLKRIAAATECDAEWFDLGSDLFQKDFGLVTLRLYAAAAQLLDVRCGIPRSLIFKQGARAALNNALKFVRLGGFKPFIQIHTHLANLDDFNEEGWNECYRCCADLYRSMPELLGMFGSSWFYDPLLASISPRIAYLRDIPLAGGAELFFFESGGSAIGNALATSPSRCKLYEEGKYMPTNYLVGWGKQQQIAWAERNPGNPY